MGIPVKIFLSRKVCVFMQCITIDSVPETRDLYTHSLRSWFKMTVGCFLPFGVQDDGVFFHSKIHSIVFSKSSDVAASASGKV